MIYELPDINLAEFIQYFTYVQLFFAVIFGVICFVAFLIDYFKGEKQI